MYLIVKSVFFFVDGRDANVFQWWQAFSQPHLQPKWKVARILEWWRRHNLFIIRGRVEQPFNENSTQSHCGNFHKIALTLIFSVFIYWSSSDWIIWYYCSQKGSFAFYVKNNNKSTSQIVSLIITNQSIKTKSPDKVLKVIFLVVVIFKQLYLKMLK